MERFTVVSTDCHAGLPPEQYRSYLDPEYREPFDQVPPIQKRMTDEAEKVFLPADINAQWRAGVEEALTGAWDHERAWRSSTRTASPARSSSPTA